MSERARPPGVASKRRLTLGHPDRWLTLVCATLTTTLVAACTWVLGDVVVRGAGELSLGDLLSAPTHAGRGGGIGPILVSTTAIVLVCASAVVPLGLLTALSLTELAPLGGPLTRRIAGALSRSIDILAAVPSIVFGLFGALFFGDALGLGSSIAAGGLTLACMVLPLFVRCAQVGFRAIGDDERLAAAALGLARWRFVLFVLLPRSRTSLAVAFSLSMARALAETAALIHTAGYSDRMPRSLLDSGRSVSVHIYDLALNVPGAEPRAYASALVLLGATLALHVPAGLLVARIAARHGRG